jgi:hypothetical protein
MSQEEILQEQKGNSSKEFVLSKSSAGFQQFEGQPVWTYCKQRPFQAIVLLLISGYLSKP